MTTENKDTTKEALFKSLKMAVKKPEELVLPDPNDESLTDAQKAEAKKKQEEAEQKRVEEEARKQAEAEEEKHYENLTMAERLALSRKIKADKEAANKAQEGEPDPNKSAEKPDDDDPPVVVKKPTVEAPVKKEDDEPEDAPESTDDDPFKDVDVAGFSDDETDEVELAKFAEIRNPDQYKGFAKKTADFIRKHKEYIEKKQESDPTITFDSENDEYQKWLERNRVQLTTRERKRLAREKIIEETRAEVRKDFEAENRKLSSKLRELELKPVLENTVKQFEKEAYALVDDVGNLISEKGVKAATEERPLEVGIVQEYVQLATQAASEFIMITQGLKAPDPKNSQHKWLADFVEEQAAIFKQTGGDKLIRDGKKFVSRFEFNKLSAEDRKKHFTLSETDVLHLLQYAAKQAAEAKIKSEKERLEKAGYVRKAPVAQVSDNQDDDTPSPRATPSPSPGVASTPEKPKNPLLKAILGTTS